MAQAIYFPEVVRIFSIGRWVKYNHSVKQSTWPCILFRCLFAFNTQASYGATELQLQKVCTARPVASNWYIGWATRVAGSVAARRQFWWPNQCTSCRNRVGNKCFQYRELQKINAGCGWYKFFSVLFYSMKTSLNP